MIFCSHTSSFQIFTWNDSLSTCQGLPTEEYVEFKSKSTQVQSHGALQGLFIQTIKGKDCILSSPHTYHHTTMSSDQCAKNSDSSLKDAKDIQWFNDPDDSNPLPTPTAEPLDHGLWLKTTNQLLDTLAHELLDSDEEDAEDTDGFTKIAMCKHTLCCFKCFQWCCYSCSLVGQFLWGTSRWGLRKWWQWRLLRFHFMPTIFGQTPLFLTRTLKRHNDIIMTSPTYDIIITSLWPHFLPMTSFHSTMTSSQEHYKYASIS